jgi:ABC-2 type transport system ATP-binding protein
MATVEVVGLRREFASKKNTVVALDGVDLEVQEGEIFGLLGPNGAGKTTLIRILSTLLLPSSGRATVMGYDIVRESGKVRPLISMASGAERPAYDFITARGNLWFFSQLCGIDSVEARRRIASLATSLELGEYLDRKMYALSTGYRQGVTIARAFINDPSWSSWMNPRSASM